MSDKPTPLRYWQFPAVGGALFIGALLLAALDVGHFEVGDKSVSGPEFLRSAGAVFGAVGVLLTAIAFGLWRERHWARVIIVSFFPIVGIVIVAFVDPASARDMGELIPQTIALLLVTAALGWYFYSKREVVAYYQRLKQRDVAE